MRPALLLLPCELSFISSVLGGPTGGASKKGTVRILTVKMEWWKPMFVGSAPLGCNANPLTGYILASFGPFIGRQKSMKKRLFEAMLTPKLHGTASCRHTVKGAALARCVYQCLQRGGKGAVT